MCERKESIMKTLVIGGTGKTGSRVTEKLRNKGAAVRVASRNSSVVFDWQDPGTWSEALAGVEAVYLNYAPDLAVPGAENAIRIFVDKAIQADIKRIVVLSGRGEEGARDCERIVQASNIECTVVRASWFNQNFSEGEFVHMVRQGSITLPGGDIREPYVDVEDIADVIVAALTETGHAGEVYEVTGPRAMTLNEVAEEISAATQRHVNYLDIPHEGFLSALKQSGMPEDLLWLMDYLFSTVLDGRNSEVQDGVQRALGRGPRDFGEYARETSKQDYWEVAA